MPLQPPCEGLPQGRLPPLPRPWTPPSRFSSLRAQRGGEVSLDRQLQLPLQRRGGVHIHTCFWGTKQSAAVFCRGRPAASGSFPPPQPEPQGKSCQGNGPGRGPPLLAAGSPRGAPSSHQGSLGQGGAERVPPCAWHHGQPTNGRQPLRHVPGSPLAALLPAAAAQSLGQPGRTVCSAR